MLVTLLTSRHIETEYPQLGTVLQLCREEGCPDASDGLCLTMPPRMWQSSLAAAQGVAPAAED